MGVWPDKNRPSWSFVRTKACMRPVMLLCNYQSSTTRNKLMSALKTDQSVHRSHTRPTMLLFLFCALQCNGESQLYGS